VTPKLDFKVTELPITIDALDVLCVQLTRDLFAIAKFLVQIRTQICLACLDRWQVTRNRKMPSSNVRRIRVDVSELTLLLRTRKQTDNQIDVEDAKRNEHVNDLRQTNSARRFKYKSVDMLQKLCLSVTHYVKTDELQ